MGLALLKNSMLDKTYTVALLPDVPACPATLQWRALSVERRQAIIDKHTKRVRRIGTDGKAEWDEDVDYAGVGQAIVAESLVGWSGLSAAVAAEHKLVPFDADGLAAEGGAEWSYSREAAQELVRESALFRERVMALSSLDEVQRAREALAKNA